MRDVKRRLYEPPRRATPRPNLHLCLWLRIINQRGVSRYLSRHVNAEPRLSLYGIESFLGLIIYRDAPRIGARLAKFRIVERWLMVALLSLPFSPGRRAYFSPSRRETDTKRGTLKYQGITNAMDNASEIYHYRMNIRRVSLRNEGAR